VIEQYRVCKIALIRMIATYSGFSFLLACSAFLLLTAIEINNQKPVRSAQKERDIWTSIESRTNLN